jgi:hypothetical protein
MKIRSLLLGSVAAAGLATTGFAADLGVVTSLDVCDELGLSGLTISSDDNCLVITGGVSFEYSYGSWTATPAITLANGGVVNVNTVHPTPPNAALDIDAWLQFVATADSDFGPATATIKLLSDNNNGVDDDPDTMDTDEWDVQVDAAWVGIGDTTMLMAGKKGSIFNAGDDAPLNYLGLFNSSIVDAGVGFVTTGAVTGGSVIQLVHNLGNGLSIGGGVENLMTAAPASPTLVGVIAYAGDGMTAHASGAWDGTAYKVHAGFTGTWDPIKVVAAVAADDTGYWNALGSLSATFDIFTLAVSGEADSMGDMGVGGSASALVSEGVTINLGARYITNGGGGELVQAEAGISAAVTETITATAAVGGYWLGNAGTDNIYGKAGLAWAPGGGFTASIAGEANTLGAYKGTFKAAKTIK